MTDRLRSDVAGSSRWLPAVLLLLVAATLTAITPAFPVVTTADGSAATAAVGTAWLAALPVLFVLIATMVRTDLGVAAVAGAGLLAVGRLLADLGLLLAPDAVLRPELFGVENVSAFPLTPAWGAAFPLIADVLAVAGAGLAARTVLDGYEPPAFEQDGPRRVRALTVTPFSVVSLIAVALLISAGLGVLWASPVPVVRPLGVADIGLFGTAGAALGGLVLCLVAVVASALPLRSARGLLLGAGAASAVPTLTVVLAGGDVHASALAWVGLVGAVLLAFSGLLLRAPAGEREAAASTSPETDDDFVDRPAPSRWPPVVVGVLTVAAAGCAVLAYREPQATSLLGSAGASFDAAGAGYLPAAVVLLLCGVAVLVPATARWGLVALGVGWLPPVVAALTALEFTSSSIWVSTAVFTRAGGVERSAGSWWGVAAAGTAVAAAVLAAVVTARQRDATPALDPPDDPESTVRVRAVLSWALTALTVIAYALPVFSANDRSSSALFVGGARVDTYAAWLSVIVLVAADWVGCSRRSRPATAVILGSAAIVAACRLALTPAVRHQVAFELRPGFYLSGLLVLALVTAAVVRWRQVVDAPSASGPSDRLPAGRPEASARSSATRPGGAVRGKNR